MWLKRMLDPQFTESPVEFSFGVIANVADEDSVSKMFAEIIGKFGRVDILVNNAAVCPTHLLRICRYMSGPIPLL